MRKGSQGFTLIELLIVIGIIGILTALVAVNLQGARERARDTQRKADLDQIQKALELYKNDSFPQQYPEEGDGEWKVEIVSGGYMKEFPQDPTNKATSTWPNYYYERDGVDPLQYDLVACLENAADINLDSTNNTVVCTAGYSYTLTEP